MTSHRIRQQLLALTLPAGYFLTPLVASGQSTWNGTTSAAWNVATNWSPGIPVDPANIIIATTTTNGLTLDTNHAIGSLTFGSTTPRVAAFTLTTNANALTINGGITANGAFTVTGPTLRGNYIISQNQTFTVAGTPGSATADAGLFFRGNNETAGTTPAGTLVLNADVTKAGPGQFCVINTNVSGAGSIITNEGALKLNAGGNQPLIVSGGNITMNGTSSLFFSRNSGTFNITRPITLNDTTAVVLGGGVEGSVIASNFTFNGTHALTVARDYTISGALSGIGTITRTGDPKTLTLSGTASGFTGTLINNAATLNIQNAFGGNLQVGGGAVTAAGSVAGSATASAGTLSVGGLLSGSASVTGTGTLSVGGLVSGSASVTGTGTLTLNGGITGSAFVSGGTLNLNSAAADSVTVLNAAVNGEGTVSAFLDLTTVTLGIRPATPGSLHTAADLTLNGTNTVTLQGAVPLGTPFKVISYDGSLGGDETNFALAGGVGAYRGFTFTNNTAGKSIDLSVTAGAVTWTGAFSGAWDVNATTNWTGTSDKFFQLDAVTFPNLATTKLVALSSTVSPTSITFENDLGNDYVISGSGTGFISGGASITKNGGGVTILGGANGQNFLGPIAVNAGILRMGSRDAFGQTSGITIADGAQVDINGQTPGQVATGGYTYTIAGTGPAPLNAGALVNTNAGVVVEMNAGVKNLVLSADATIGGAARFDIGAANLAGFGTITGNGHTLTVKNTAQVPFRGDASGTPINIVASGGAIWAENNDNGLGGATGTVTVNTGAKVGTYGVRTIATPVTLNAGATLHNQGGGASTWTGSITLAGDTTAFDTNAQAITISGTLAESGGSRILTKIGAGTLTLTSTAANTGNTVITNGNVQVGNGGTTGAINTNPIDLVAATSCFIINRSDDITIPNVITGLGPAANASNPSALTKYGTGTLTLTGASTFTGATRVDGGTVAIGSNETVFGTGLLDTRVGTVRSSDATARTINNPVSYSATMTLGSPTTGNLLFTGPVGAGAVAKSFIVQNAVTEFSGVISGNASTNSMTKDGPGTLIFSNDNTYFQTTTISAGIMQVGNGGIAGNLSTTNVINNAALVINRSLGEGVTEFTFNNNISGTGSLTHSGPALTVLGGANTYTGDTIVTNGILSHTLPNFADVSSIQISGTAKLNLVHPETDTVSKLVIDGTPQAVGVYGAVGSGAQFTTPFITGSGKLNVTSDGTGTPYSNWATDKGLTPGNNAATDNPDNDGLDNLGEFAFDGNPLSGSTGGKMVVKVANIGGTPALTLTLPVRTTVGAFAGATSLTATADGVTYTIEGSDALALSGWTLDIDEVTGADATAIQAGLPALSGAGWTYRTFRSPGAVAGDPADFLRARVE